MSGGAAKERAYGRRRRNGDARERGPLPHQPKFGVDQTFILAAHALQIGPQPPLYAFGDLVTRKSNAPFSSAMVRSSTLSFSDMAAQALLPGDAPFDEVRRASAVCLSRLLDPRRHLDDRARRVPSAPGCSR